MLVQVLLFITSVALTSCDVSHLETTTELLPPRPYAFSYTAGRYPGDIDRQHAEVSDGSGVVKGTFSYVDPRHKVRTVDYVADKDGFHPVLSDVPPEHPTDSEAVARAKDRHFQLYAKIAEDHAQHPFPDETSIPRQSAAVAAAAAKHAQLFRVIAEQHARIAAEREALQQEEEEKLALQELH
ncbi:larval cuticle protein LCP-17-like [Danaus plexippus]|uniref:Cuticular protein RR-1 motif 56 n=1 Tax=Danaus plexippus plexippus TaxID=278856 RepID=A0A212F263_DANPL|nr:larval cuticle protein LCP-17-like [Danaus plexippus]OWR47827.1 cuticular protein RR-1 motif 56 precursor [Danaus plexippus plexippus]